jgi:hypothetical protein
LIRNEKTIVLFKRHCHLTEKSEAIACARSILVNKVVDPKRRANEEERNKVADPPPTHTQNNLKFLKTLKGQF